MTTDNNGELSQDEILATLRKATPEERATLVPQIWPDATREEIEDILRYLRRPPPPPPRRTFTLADMMRKPPPVVEFYFGIRLILKYEQALERIARFSGVYDVKIEEQLVQARRWQYLKSIDDFTRAQAVPGLKAMSEEAYELAGLNGKQEIMLARAFELRQQTVKERVAGLQQRKRRRQRGR